ncbi:hypothetical protein AnigIFM60653_001335 [Aspergillus niger]|nr:hypothetical protein AnigIFM60653_001335 [Aspergillus niger]
MRFTPIILAMATVAVAIPLNHDMNVNREEAFAGAAEYNPTLEPHSKRQEGYPPAFEVHPAKRQEGYPPAFEVHPSKRQEGYPPAFEVQPSESEDVERDA